MVYRTYDSENEVRADRPVKSGAADLHLPGFLPYRLSRLTNRISRSIARIYADRFDMTIPEWRVMAILAEYPDISASEVAEWTAMDKVAVSRAVSRLRRAGRVERHFAQEDRRRSVLALTEEGRDVHARIVPLAKAYETAILDRLDDAERDMLNRLLGRLEELKLEALTVDVLEEESGASDGT